MPRERHGKTRGGGQVLGAWGSGGVGRVAGRSRISPELLDRLFATVEEERGREWIRTV